MRGTCQRHSTQQHRMGSHNRTRGLVLARLRRLGIAVISGIMLTASSAIADEVIVVPRDAPTIQAAVDAAPRGATIKVRRGTYTEEIVIAKDLTLQGAGLDKTTITSPPTLTSIGVHGFNGKEVAAIVRVTGGAHVKMSGFTVSGPIPCGVNVSGLRAVKASRLDLSDSRVTGMVPVYGQCAPEDALGAGISFGAPPFIEIEGEPGAIGHGSVSHVAIDTFQDAGIRVAGSTPTSRSTATISDNVVTGGTPFPVLGQSGISVNYGAVARVTKNTVRDMVCTVPTCGRDPINEFQSFGIGATATEAPGTVIEKNAVIDNEVGIYLLASPGCCETRNNKVTDNQFFGVLIQDGSNDTADNNIRGGEVGIGVVADAVDTVAVLHGDEISRAALLPVQEIDCCGFTATAIRRK
jgi:parallel beta-helix repeat protein